MGIWDDPESYPFTELQWEPPSQNHNTSEELRVFGCFWSKSSYIKAHDLFILWTIGKMVVPSGGTL